ncbi:carbohydrate kinase family protein [Streptomyces capillispiralis]|uniref:Sugar/nucleoside kinase (Ribokinase family) n=1 Tax=Streptomyces capillispiralis TaxID=68182 RepID=A0A561TK78_9ACTN|nr:PfkB family carbohydrate kinase [Streptomyces capillispiralis]TWF87566.1 sugar/nucleoside kinase (ribokinase family) [Streptomyces capillispiralis]GHH93700.1 sugar kinase [Streptomyces capillispiralis]
MASTGKAVTDGSHRSFRVDPLAALRTPHDPPWDVYLTGTVFLDIVFTGLDSAPVRGTESWARGMGSSPGGVANMATALARLGLRTSLAAAFGDDHYGEYCWDALEQGEGIDLSPSRTVPGWHSPVTVSMAYEGERTMVSHGHEPPPEEPDRPSPATTRTRRPPGAGLPPCPPRARAAVASLTPGRSAPWIAQAVRQGARIFGDVGWDDTGAWDLAALGDLRHCEAFLPNAQEAMRYTGTDCPRAAAHALTEHVPVAVVTLGAEGAYAVDRRTGETASVPAIEVEALDPTGAGDVFVAGFVTGTLAGWPLADRLAFAGLTAALSVQEFGGSLSAPGWTEIAGWWRRVQSVEGQDPAALRRYAFLADVVPEDCVRPWPLRRAVPTIGFRRSA